MQLSAIERYAPPTPLGFRFAPKFPQVITHEKRLLAHRLDLPVAAPVASSGLFDPSPPA